MSEAIISNKKKLELMKIFFLNHMENLEIIEFRNLDDKEFPQVFLQKKGEKYFCTNDMLSFFLIKEEDMRLITLEQVMELLEELLELNYIIIDAEKKFKMK